MRVRAHVLLLLASGCSLYFGSPQSDERPSNAPPDGSVPDSIGPPSAAAMARCEDSQIYVATAVTFPDPPGHGSGHLIGRCEGSCRSAAVLCATADCKDAAHTLCEAPISVGATCPFEGTACMGSQSIDCPLATGCTIPVANSQCACAGETYHCHPVTPSAATQAAIVGKWQGAVTIPGWALPPYPVTLWIYPDGTYWPDCPNEYCSAFYYGGDGPSPLRRITILTTYRPEGSWADIAIDFGYADTPPNIGMLGALIVDATTLRFTFTPSWGGCGRLFDFNLTRY